MKNSKSKPIPSQDELRRIFSYDENEGCLVWKDRNAREFVNHRIYMSWRARRVGRPAGYMGAQGYVSIEINGSQYRAHRLIYEYVFGGLSVDMEIDHLDGDQTNNRSCNLRAVTGSVNRRNVPKYKNNKTGFSGVHWCKPNKKWKAVTSGPSGPVYFGYFTNFEDAKAVILNFRKDHGYTNRHGH